MEGGKEYIVEEVPDRESRKAREHETNFTEVPIAGDSSYTSKIFWYQIVSLTFLKPLKM